MPRIRQQNLFAAQWAPNGGALGAPDLTVPDNQVFGANVFSPHVQRQRLPTEVFNRLQVTLARGEALDTSLADAVALGHEGVGTRARRHPLHPLVSAADRLDGREARQLLRTYHRGHRAGRILGQGTDPGRARCVFVPDGRNSRDVRGPRLHRVGSHLAGLHPREPQRHPAVHPDRVRVVDRRGARPQDPAAALHGRAVEARRSAPCGCSATTAPRACSPRSVPSRSTS